MKLIFTILIFISSLKANCQSEWKAVGIDTVPCLFKVTSNRYENSIFTAKKGYVVRVVIKYTGDKIPCTDPEDCDYTDRHRTIQYLDYKKKILDEEKWHVWDVKSTEQPKILLLKEPDLIEEIEIIP